MRQNNSSTHARALDIIIINNTNGCSVLQQEEKHVGEDYERERFVQEEENSAEKETRQKQNDAVGESENRKGEEKSFEKQ